MNAISELPWYMSPCLSERVYKNIKAGPYRFFSIRLFEIMRLDEMEMYIIAAEVKFRSAKTVEEESETVENFVKLVWETLGLDDLICVIEKDLLSNK